MAITLSAIQGIGPHTADVLAEHGYSKVEELAAAQESDLVVISGFGPVRANLVINAAKSLLEEEQARLKEEQDGVASTDSASEILSPSSALAVSDEEPSKKKKKSKKKKGNPDKEKKPKKSPKKGKKDKKGKKKK
ncbi:helix-hairpin-helix domain-containing protein [Desulfobulbus rhabdoformis]|uniref:helix-hairpin-helix domain-containing protein n=1 Tax=Desulfobulbus rhabdoformis TaxID=34032 RepID=UPI001964F91B|nr:helix-hairpin-helix domain-containing protein [Desulfobulbus rhabdoformis]MBM9614673.1 helix-hairpin-helix domain-containing protein [Desulfobulbus rhabdoformis]